MKTNTNKYNKHWKKTLRHFTLSSSWFSHPPTQHMNHDP